MIADPLLLSVPIINVTAKSGEISFGLQDLDAGKTVRTFAGIDGNVMSLQVSHNESTENKGILTNRSTIRINSTSLGFNDSGDNYVAYKDPVTASVSISLALPRAPGYTAQSVVILFQYVLSLIATNGNVGSADYTRLVRILNGEP